MDAADRRLSSLFLIPLMLAFVGLLLFMALLNGQRDLTVLSLILFGVAAGAKLWTRWSLAGIECSVSIDKRRAFPGEKLYSEGNGGKRKVPPCVAAGEGARQRPCPWRIRRISEAAVTAETSLLWYQKARFRWELTARAEGSIT